MFSYLKTIADLYIPSVEVEDAEEGQGMVEYALILALIAIAALAILGTMGGQISDIFTTVSERLGSASEGGS